MPVAVYQSRFKGEKDWHWCSPEHVAMVAATPSEWQGYEARYLYAHAAPAHPAEGGASVGSRPAGHCGQAQAVKLLAADHSGMKVDYRGLFSQVQRGSSEQTQGMRKCCGSLKATCGAGPALVRRRHRCCGRDAAAVLH